jgi:hypothetical protein
MRHREDAFASRLPPLDAPQREIDDHKNAQRQSVGQGQQSLERNQQCGCQHDTAGEHSCFDRRAGSWMDAAEHGGKLSPAGHAIEQPRQHHDLDQDAVGDGQSPLIDLFQGSNAT